MLTGQNYSTKLEFATHTFARTECGDPYVVPRRRKAAPAKVRHQKAYPILFFVNRTCDGFCLEHIGISIYSAGKNLSKNRITGPSKGEIYERCGEVSIRYLV